MRLRLRLVILVGKPKESDGANVDVTVAYPAPPAGGATLFRVDDLIVDLGRCRVMHAGVDLKLPGLSFDLFVALVRAAPNIATVPATNGYRLAKRSRQSRDHQPTCQTPEGGPRRRRQEAALRWWSSKPGISDRRDRDRTRSGDAVARCYATGHAGSAPSLVVAG